MSLRRSWGSRLRTIDRDSGPDRTAHATAAWAVEAWARGSNVQSRCRQPRRTSCSAYPNPCSLTMEATGLSPGPAGP
jgi:hypothetical protein